MNVEKLHRFTRLSRIVGEESLLDLKNRSVLVLGCGGVGGYVVEGIVRSGVGTVILVDGDVVDITNINRQIIALESTIGLKKVDVLEQRVLDINPCCNVIKIDKFIDSSCIDELFSYDIDYFVDACDTISTKKDVIRQCLSKNISFISSMGTGNHLDPSKLQITDIRNTFNDPIARILRKFVRDENIKEKILVIFSSEVPLKTNDGSLGSVSFVPSCAGLFIAGYIIRELTGFSRLS